MRHPLSWDDAGAGGGRSIGTEHEKLVYKLGSLEPAGYAEIQGLLNGLRERFDWEPIMEGGNPPLHSPSGLAQRRLPCVGESPRLPRKSPRKRRASHPSTWLVSVRVRISLGPPRVDSSLWDEAPPAVGYAGTHTIDGCSAHTWRAGENIIGTKLNGQSVTLEPGGQFELSGAPLETLHATCAEVNSHLYQVRCLLHWHSCGVHFF